MITSKTIVFYIRYSKKQDYNISLTKRLIITYLPHYKEQKNHAKAWLVNLY